MYGLFVCACAAVRIVVCVPCMHMCVLEVMSKMLNEVLCIERLKGSECLKEYL